ncbi:MAG: ABC transporter substrate-binding protein [Candidatus Rokubacteria bacterium]|nr:ABC transporter substrate-binding protein [Candidatus Rokubacteria bacterium]
MPSLEFLRLLLVRAGLALGLALAVIPAPGLAPAHAADKLPRIGFLWPGPADLYDAFRQGLGELGYVEGRTVLIEARVTGGSVSRLAEQARDLARLKVDVLVVGSTQAIHAARQATATIPIVMALSGDAVSSGLVASLARPGGNVTGLTIISADLAGKRLELLREVVPSVTRLAIFWNPTNLSHEPVLRELEAVAQRLGLAVQRIELNRAEDIERAFEKAAAGRAGALLVLGDFVTLTSRVRIAELAAKHRLAAMYEVREFVEAGGLMAYGVNLAQLFKRAAVFTDKILKGARPAELPVEQPTRFELIVNVKAARAVGLTFTPDILLRADQVIE